jgi:hypothetical protein
MMAKITKRAVDALQPDKRRDVFTWDSELRGFGVRVKPSGVKTFLIQYRNVERRTRRLVLGQYGVPTPENARELAREKLAGAAKGEDPSAERHAVRAGMSVSDSQIATRTFAVHDNRLTSKPVKQIDPALILILSAFKVWRPK